MFTRQRGSPRALLCPEAAERSQRATKPGLLTPLTPALPMNLTLGARRLRRFNVQSLKTLEHGSGVNAALRFRGSTRDIFRGMLSPLRGEEVAGRGLGRGGVGARGCGSRIVDAVNSPSGIRPVMPAGILGDAKSTVRLGCAILDQVPFIEASAPL